MSGWDGKHEPSEERGQAAWAAGELAREPVTPPPWASAQTQTSFSAPWHIPAPTQPAPRRAHRLLPALLTAAVLGAGVGTGVWYLIRDDAPATGTAPLPRVTVTTPSAPTLNSPSPSPSSLPGYRRAQDPVGYTLHVPEDWIRSQKQGDKAPVVRYDSPDGGRSLQIFALAEDTPAESLDLAENDPGYGFSNQPGYQALDRASAATWSELTYRYDDENKGPRQVIDHRFEAADGTPYAIRAAGPEDLAPALVREPLAAALESFCPAGGGCR
ncbi:hypothetical protein [Streptomyces cyaneus]|uniref:hypothetical protein n=1 Tax=Streptomyces cyaneus TaxID=1904 RepID=UPI000FF8A7F2|nr:hypothetical protein [Streptomyces cyaneus]